MWLKIPTEIAVPVHQNIISHQRSKQVTVVRLMIPEPAGFPRVRRRRGTRRVRRSRAKGETGRALNRIGNGK